MREKFMIMRNWLEFGIFMTLLPLIIFPVGLFITFCCVILRFTFWKFHCFINMKHYFWKNRFCYLFSFLSLSSIYPLSLPSPLSQTLFSPHPPSTVSSSCLVILMCVGFFFFLLFCVPSEWTTPKYWATLSQ